ncbi:MAG: primosomal protein N' [Defluviitaleaceae bacterium]|nr:primosomal protein N' [Defluviitaleaceae bacterium]
MPFALVCVDVAHADVDRLFHYALGEAAPLIGQRVWVPFGRGSKPVLGYVTGLSDSLPNDVPPEKVKALLGVCEDFPVLTPENLALAFWMRDKYYTTLAACIRCITPTSKSDGRFPGTRRPKGNKAMPQPGAVTLTDEQQVAVRHIITSFDEAFPCCADASFHACNYDPDAVGGACNDSVNPVDCACNDNVSPVDCAYNDNANPVGSLNLAKDRLSKPILLHGVTGSGKTEVYLHGISHVISMGRQAIVLVPEIALTPQMVNLFTARFGKAVAVTHSRLTAGERFQIWKQALDGEVSLIIGPRSAVFAPFKRLGLIVIDEEHEHSYHSDITPKYDARAVAVKRGELSNAVVVLGSATPSLESYSRAVGDTGRRKAEGGEQKADVSSQKSEVGGQKADASSQMSGGVGQKTEGGESEGHFQVVDAYSLIKMTKRVNQTFPKVTVLDMRRELTRGNTSLFAAAFKTALAETLAAGKQAILFLNRRGHSTFVSCRLCGLVMACDHCRVNYTYHTGTGGGRLVCHYCGRGGAMPKVCPVCESVHIKQFGAGTQKVEEEVKRLFPDAATLRMDMDTTRGKHGHAKILDMFRKGDGQILIGTQMVAKGLDFPNVVLVCVVSADLSLFTGDFRAGEYTFQLLTQVAGRAGRAAGDVGQVFLQTYNPEHYALELAKNGDYEAFYAHEIGLRRAMLYPPFSHVFSIMLSGPDEKGVIAALRKLWAIMDYSKKISESGKTSNQFELLGMSPAYVSKIKNQFRWKILVKCNNEEPLKAFVLYCVRKLRENDPLTGINLHLTLDPVMLD